MSCACKKAKELQEKFPELNEEKHIKGKFNLLLYRLKNSVLNFFTKIFFCIAIMALTPFIVVYILISYFVNGSVKLPKNAYIK